jgi:hypothetical protein
LLIIRLCRTGLNPYGLTALTVPLLKPQQDYDISVALSMPRSPPNVQRGNFMVSLYLLGSENGYALAEDARKFANREPSFEQNDVLFHSRRPALLPYIDPVVSLASRVLFLLYHLIFPTAQNCTMKIPVAERVAFPTDSSIPLSAYVEIEAGQDIQIYSASLTMTAQLSGLRWLMFHYRLLTFTVFTTVFWVCELAFMSVAWAIFGSLMGTSPSNKLEYKTRKSQRRSTTEEATDPEDSDENDENDGGSDHPHQFPTYGKQPALKHEPDIKDEEEHKQPLYEIPVAGEEADDEEDVGSPRDSGIGTSYSGEGSSSVRKRKSQSRLE